MDLVASKDRSYSAVSWPYLLGVFSLLANGFTFFLLLLLGDFDDAESSA